jgi:hypothetical protein
MQPDLPVPPPPANRTRNILLLIFSIAGGIGFSVRGLYLVITGIRSFSATNTSLGSNLLEALGMFVCAGLLLPMLFSSIRRLKGQVALPGTVRPIKAWQLILLITGWLAVVAFGAILNSVWTFGWAIAAPFFVLGIGLPIFGLFWIGSGGIQLGSRQRLWSAFGVGLAGSTVGAILLEYMFIGLAVLGAGVVASSNPVVRAILQDVKAQAANAGDIQTLLTNLAPYLTNPLVVLAILVFASVLAPMIEEACKPAFLWLVGKRLQSPAEGFVLGMVCGAGFAMLEGINAASGAVGSWGFGMIGRAAASLMHIACSGIVGWGIASAMLEKRYRRLPFIYLLSVSIHGLWNASALAAVYGSLRMVANGMKMDAISILAVLGGLLVLGTVLVLMLVAFPLINRQLRKTSSVPDFLPVQNDIIAPPQP